MRQRRRRGRVLVFLSVAAAAWWTPGGTQPPDLPALDDPATYAQLLGTIETWLDGARVTQEVSASDSAESWAPAPAMAGTIRRTPPVGAGEAEERLALPVSVSDENAAYRFAARQDDGTSPVAWSPCRAIGYVVNDAGAPVGFADEVRAAMDEVSAATGLVFVDEGTTTEVASQERGAYLPERYGDRWAPVLVAVADAKTLAFLEGDTAGVAYTYRAQGLESGLWHLVSGSVYLDGESFELPLDQHAEPGWTTVLRHEIGHLVGLDHLDDPTQLMNPVTSREVHAYQAGDLTGLARLGRGACAPDV
jgi:hypothetical protein